FFDLDTLLKSHQRRFSWFYSYWFVLIVFGLLSIPKDWLSPEIYDRVHLASIPFGFWYLWVAFIRLRRHSTIHLEHKTVAKTFFQRNQDQLAVGLIAAIIGAVIGVAATKLADRIPFTPPSNETQ